MDGMVFYKSWFDALADIPAEDFKAAVMAMAAFGMEDIEPELSGIAKVIFTMARPTIERRKADSENGSKGGRPKQKRGVSEKQKGGFSETKSTETETDTETENIIAEPDGSVSRSNRAAEISAVIADWNTLPEPVPRITRTSTDSTRFRMLKARIAEVGVDKVKEAIRNIRDSDFLLGKNGKGWWITFDWFVKPTNFTKVLEGNYKNTRAAPAKNPAQAFNAFHQRDNDYEAIERALIAKQAGGA